MAGKISLRMERYAQVGKRCPKCGETKPLTADWWNADRATVIGFGAYCKACQRAQKNARRAANRDHDRTLRRASRTRCQAHAIEYDRKRRTDPKRKEQERQRSRARMPATQAWVKRKRNSDTNFRLRCVMSRRLAKLMGEHKGGKSWRTIVGYDEKQLRAHLERQFSGRMTWENYGSHWHIDHILPKASFNHENEEEMRACWALANLRPLTAAENHAKSFKRLHLI